MIQFLVDAGTFYAAVAKGAAAASLLTSAPDESVDDCTLIYDLEGEPAPQMIEDWPTLLTATEVTSAAGDALLSAARDRTGKEDSKDRSQTEIPRVYDERGERIREESALDHSLDGSDQLWLVPAIAVETVPKRDPPVPEPKFRL